MSQLAIVPCLTPLVPLQRLQNLPIDALVAAQSGGDVCCCLRRTNSVQVMSLGLILCLVCKRAAVSVEGLVYNTLE